MSEQEKKRGDINITNNYYAPIGQHIDHVDTVNFTMDGDGTFHFGQVEKMESGRWKMENDKCHEVPERLKAEEAKEVMEDLVNEGLLDEDWQPLGLSGSERGVIAKAVCDYLKINEVWQVFGQLWNEKPETLRGYFNKALEQKKSLEFQDRLKKILH